MTDAVPLHKGLAMGQHGLGYGHQPPVSGGRNPGLAAGGHVAKHHSGHHVPTAGHHNMHGHIGKGSHGHTHKTHGHFAGGGGVHHQEVGGVGEGGAPTGKSQSGKVGPSDNQFGGGMPSTGGSSLHRW